MTCTTRRALLVAGAALATATAAWAAAPSYPVLSANLDADPARERVVLLKGEGLTVAIEDLRPGGRSCLERVTPSFDAGVPRLRAVEVSGELPRELLYDGGWTVDGRVGEFGLIGIVGPNERPGKCLHVSRPFRYVQWRSCAGCRRSAAQVAPPRGFEVSDFRVRIRELRRRSRGREIELTEWYRPRGAKIATLRRVTLLRCCRQGRYVRYQTRVAPS